MHSQPLSLLVGVACGVVTAWACAWLTGWATMAWLAAGLTTVSALRVGISQWLVRHPTGLSSRRLYRFYPVLALAYAALAGTIAALTVLWQARIDVQVLAVAHALAYGGGIAVRSAGRPRLAVAQVITAMAPLTLACAQAGQPGLLVLAVLLPFYTLGMALVSIAAFRQLAQQMCEADGYLREASAMRDMAVTDETTGLANRAGLRAALDALASGREDSQHLLLLRLDLRRFRELNGSMGPETGDRLLVAAAKRLRQAIDQRGVIGRLGGGEFAIVLPCSTPEEGHRLAQEIEAVMAQPLRIDGIALGDGTAMGAALMPRDAASPGQLLQAAELALAQARTRRGAGIVFYDISMQQERTQRREIEDELRSAIMKDELSIVFQPIVHLATGRVRSFEALVRWYHPERGELVPAQFIPVAEESGLIITLGNWITAQAARAAADWPEDVTLAVNLSAAQIRAPGAALGVLNALREARLDPARLMLDVTEDLFTDEDPQVAEFMTELSREGVGFALDDFGTGSSSLHYIHRYPFRTIKVDRSFVSGPRMGRESDAIIRAVAEMGATLSMEIVAEGIETAEQVTKVTAAGCTLGQGYYFSRAVPQHEAAALLADQGESKDRRAG